MKRASERERESESEVGKRIMCNNYKKGNKHEICTINGRQTNANMDGQLFRRFVFHLYWLVSTYGGINISICVCVCEYYGWCSVWFDVDALRSLLH